MSEEAVNNPKTSALVGYAEAFPGHETAPRVWIGCLACYNAGRLLGEWYEAAAASTVTTDTLHADAGTVARASCEELWVMDTEGLPVSREMSPDEATKWADVLSEVDEWHRDALAAWVRSGDYVAAGHGDIPSLPDFEERYAGEWDSFEDYAAGLFEELGYAADMPEHLAPYLDMRAWARDLAYDYVTEASCDGGVHVFRSL